MRSRNPQKAEDAFSLLSSRAADLVPELIEAFSNESAHAVRCWLLELLGEARDSRATELFASLLESDDEAFVHWAVSGLRALDSKEARRALWEHGIK
jgi:hypothetical protein